MKNIPITITYLSQINSLVPKLFVGKKNLGGRNNFGRITVFTKGGGHSQNYRLIDFTRGFYGIPAKVIRFDYDPNRTCFIALVLYSNGILTYILAPSRLAIDDFVISNSVAPLSVGNHVALRSIPLGSYVHNLEIISGFGGKFVRAAGTKALVLKHDTVTNRVLVKLPSKEERFFNADTFGTVGSLSNSTHYLKQLETAGRARWLNKRPNVRGVAMNPVDHPHGGRTGASRPLVSAWGFLTKGVKTRKRKTSKFIYKRRSK